MRRSTAPDPRLRGWRTRSSMPPGDRSAPRHLLHLQTRASGVVRAPIRGSRASSLFQRAPGTRAAGPVDGTGANTTEAQNGFAALANAMRWRSIRTGRRGNDNHGVFAVTPAV